LFLRRTRRTSMMNGAPTKVVSEILGHSDVQTTDEDLPACEYRESLWAAKRNVRHVVTRCYEMHPRDRRPIEANQLNSKKLEPRVELNPRPVVIKSRAFTSQDGIASAGAPHPTQFLLRAKPFFRDLALHTGILGRPTVQTYQQQGYGYNNRCQAPPEQRTLLSHGQGRPPHPLASSSILQLR
jgi:hypothetical protein